MVARYISIHFLLYEFGQLKVLFAFLLERLTSFIILVFVEAHDLKSIFSGKDVAKLRRADCWLVLRVRGRQLPVLFCKPLVELERLHEVGPEEGQPEFRVGARVLPLDLSAH